MGHIEANLDDIRRFEALPENQGRLWELIEGKIIEKTGDFIPSTIVTEIVFAIKLYLREHPIGHLTGVDGSYILSPNNRPMPDVGYISKARMPEIPNHAVSMPPDLAVEVMSPTDDLREMQKKALRYLRYGAKLVWLVYPEDQTVDVYQPVENSVDVQTFKVGASLAGGAVLPGFSLPIESIFTL